MHSYLSCYEKIINTNIKSLHVHDDFLRTDSKTGTKMHYSVYYVHSSVYSEYNSVPWTCEDSHFSLPSSWDFIYPPLLTNTWAAIWVNPLGSIEAIEVSTDIHTQPFVFWLLYRIKATGREGNGSPLLLPGKSHGRRSLVGCSPWGRKQWDRAEQLHFTQFILYHWKRKWQPTPVFLPGESHGQRGPAGRGPRGRRESTRLKWQQNSRNEIAGNRN